ncbi:septal ring lytic transglycosylase RlpA family protein [Limimaricola cinnabarinus]|uniref:septal ring lytic transglycosylase RlpA family protein n=1 Tax=Limimaricola cinnabarinus TaxID=1125964 RepID=UPI001C1FEC83|nr:septal ring lytic transglycosylase RlpA family protein [Limimaricola cinnabarinus]
MIKPNALLRTLLTATCLLAAPIAIAHSDSVTRTFEGAASWYGPGFHGRLTANGETYDMNSLTAAHPDLPFGTRVRVTNEATDKSVVVRINDRGPYAGGRIIDLSKGAAGNIGLIASGVGHVTVEVLANG